MIDADRELSAAQIAELEFQRARADTRSVALAVLNRKLKLELDQARTELRDATAELDTVRGQLTAALAARPGAEH